MRFSLLISLALILSACGSGRERISRAGHCFANSNGNYIPYPVDQFKNKSQKNSRYLKVELDPASSKPSSRFKVRPGKYRFYEAHLIYLQENLEAKNPRKKYLVMHMKHVRKRDMSGRATDQRALKTECVANMPESKSIGKIHASAITDFEISKSGALVDSTTANYSFGFDSDIKKITKSSVDDTDAALKSPKAFFKEQGADFQFYKFRPREADKKFNFESRAKVWLDDTSRVYIVVRYLYQAPSKKDKSSSDAKSDANEENVDVVVVENVDPSDADIELDSLDGI